MPGPDMSQYVTRDELKGHLAPLIEIRTMLRDDMRGLHEGQIRLAEKAHPGWVVNRETMKFEAGPPAPPAKKDGHRD